ncbi:MULTISPECIES: DUF4920 domain-containing protein [unclassified Flavobacterium]|uniref:DUF4920 domain-containing protein n=1 Tax=unclassified Flavobacterium TaxID=196869 RepID=UPI001F13E5DD|nr:MULTISPECIES: DUF4920 domain-containing protein [unclassified Flavobacterium]UMY64857.1 DUF4920 domain-containing protein [Flavobacterium sp. HJ-32-4]
MKKILLVACAAALFVSCKNTDKEVAPDAAPKKETDTIVKDTVSVTQATDEAEVPEATEAPKEIVVTAAAEKPVAVEYASFGKKIAATQALTADQMLKKYKTLKKGDTIAVKFKSRVADVCKKKGCWMSLDLAKGQTAFVRFKDYGFFVPLNATNSEAIVSGRAFVDVVSVDELKHYAKDGGKSQAEIDKITEPEVTYAFTADGVLLSE